VSDRCEIERISPDLVLNRRYCACCGRRTDSFSLVRKVTPGYMLPCGYGVAWVRWNTCEAVCMPVPFNVVAGALRTAWAWLKSPRWIIERGEDAYRQGRADGYREAIRDANN
jgi:hypothetical protein